MLETNSHAHEVNENQRSLGRRHSHTHTVAMQGEGIGGGVIDGRVGSESGAIAGGRYFIGEALVPVAPRISKRLDGHAEEDPQESGGWRKFLREPPRPARR